MYPRKYNYAEVFIVSNNTKKIIAVEHNWKKEIAMGFFSEPYSPYRLLANTAESSSKH